MGFDKIAENKIREAMADGRFDDLPGRGAPIDLDEYFGTPEDVRLAYSVLKAANCVPEEVELLNEIASVERQIAAASDEGERSRLRRRWSDLCLRRDVLLERKRSRR